MKQTLIPDHFFHSKPDPETLSQKRKNSQTTFLYPTRSLQDLQSPSLLIPPQTCKNLSQKTIKTIKSLNFLADVQIAQTEDVLSTVPAKEKYEDLIKSSDLPLPYKYKRLLFIQESIDAALNNSRIYNVRLSFVNLQNSVFSTQKLRIELEHVQQILFLCPKMYQVQWKNHKIMLDLPETGVYPKFLLYNRTQVLKGEILNRVKRFHKAHMAGLRVNFDPDTSKTWHSTFNLHNLPDIQYASFPENTENQQNPKISTGKQLRATRLIVLCKVLIKIFNKRRTPSLFTKSLIKLIQKEKWTTEEPKIIENDVKEIQELFGLWISFVQTESGEVVRVNKNAEFCLKSAWRKIKSKYNA